MPSLKIPLEVGATVECRSVRKDGSRERGRIAELDGRAAVIEIENPNPRRLALSRRTVPLVTGVGAGRGGLANYKVIFLADGTPVEYPTHGRRSGVPLSGR